MTNEQAIKQINELLEFMEDYKYHEPHLIKERKELSRMNNQCHMLTCRYNVNAKCTSNPEYKICTDAVKKVLGEDRYDSFLEWEKLEIKRKGGKDE